MERGAKPMLVCLSMLVHVLPSYAQSDQPRWMWPVRERAMEPRLIAAGGLNFQGPKVVDRSLEHAEGIPWFGVELGTGVSLTMQDRWGGDVLLGGAYQSNMLWVDTLCFPVFLPNARAELRAWRLMSWPFDWWEDQWLKVGVGAGLNIQGGGTKNRTDGAFTTETRYTAMTRPYIAPELALWMDADYMDRRELAVRWVHHLDRTPAFSMVTTSSEGSATFTGTQDHLAFVFRHHFALPQRTPTGPRPTTEYDGRITDTLIALATHRSGVPLVLWDDAEHDGDTISVLLNGEVVLDHYGLSPKHHRIYLPLRWGDNTVLLVAHNEGRVPPNTARAFLRTGRGRRQLLVKTSPTRNAAVRIRWE